MAATLGSSGSVNVFSGTPRAKERQKKREVSEHERDVNERERETAKRYARQPNLVGRVVGEKKNRAAKKIATHTR